MENSNGKKNDTIENNFVYHKPNDEKSKKYPQIRDEGKSLAYLIINLCPDSRERSLAMTKLEEVIMWANASIARYE